MSHIEKFLKNLAEGAVSHMPDFFGAVIIVIIGLLVAALSVHIAKKAMDRRKVDPSLNAFVCRAIRILIYIFALLAAMSALQIATTGIVAFFSAAAAAVALALKDRLNDIASGIVILFTKPFVTGDFIEFSKYQGFVQKVDIMHTNILTYDGTNVIIPNSVISNAEINNHTAHPVVRVQIEVPIPYEADIKEVKEILYGVLQKTELTVSDDTHKPSVNLQTFGESSLDFYVRCYCDFKDYWTVYYDVTQRIKEALDENGVAIPFNQLDVHITQ